jgi:hypothetical protein
MPDMDSYRDTWTEKNELLPHVRRAVGKSRIQASKRSRSLSPRPRYNSRGKVEQYDYHDAAGHGSRAVPDSGSQMDVDEDMSKGLTFRDVYRDRR